MSQSERLRSIVRSTAIVGGSSIAVMVIGLVRSKAIALMTGLAGIGSMGLLNSFMALVAVVGAMGIGTAAIGEIAESEKQRSEAIRSIWMLATLLALLSTLAVLLFGDTFINLIDADPSMISMLWLLAPGIGVSVLVIAQGAIIVGCQRFRTLAKVQVGGAVIGALAGIGFVAAFGFNGIIGAVVSPPAATFLIGAVVLNKDRLRDAPLKPIEISARWRRIFQVGIPVMAASVVSLAVQFAMRSLVFARLGIDEAGLFQASLAITSLNISLILTALGADFLPRLVRARADGQDVGRTANEQMWAVCALSSPIILGIAFCAPWALSLLYTSQFASAETLLRWQMLGEVLRMPSFVLGYVLLAYRDSSAYFVHEAINALSLPFAFLLIPIFGLDGAGIAFAAAYLLCAVATALLVGFRHGIWLDRRSILLLWLLSLATGAAALAGSHFPLATPVLGLVLGGAAGIAVLRWLVSHDVLTSRLGRGGTAPVVDQ